MLEIRRASSLEHLAARCAEVLGEPSEDPFAPEWIAVPTGGVRVWLQRRLATALGAPEGGGGGGVSMNIRFVRADGLRNELLGHPQGTGRTDPNPWSITAMTWALMALGSDPDRVQRDPEPPLAAWAHRHATRFARYQIHRPDILGRWSAEPSPAGPIRENDQPGLYRALRDRIGGPDPVEGITGALEALRSGDIDRFGALPPRLIFFGFTLPPDGSTFPDLIANLADHLDVHYHALDPAPTGPPEQWPPLVRSWGRSLEDSRAVLAPLSEATPFSEATPSRSTMLPAERVPPPPGPAGSLLERLRDLIITGESSAAPPVALSVAADRSVIVHGCQGLTRQVEVLRDDLLGRFADDETLREEDVVVYCADLEEAAPAIHSVLGDSPGSIGSTGQATDTPDLRYHIDGLAPRATDPVAEGLARLLELATGRVTSVELLTFCQLDAVMRRWAFDDDDIATFRRWTTGLNVRWGIDPEQRGTFGIPVALSLGTWRRALDRLAMGVAYASDDLIVDRGTPTDPDADQVSPFGIESEDIDRLGGLSDLLARIELLARDAHEKLPVADWLERLRSVIPALFAPADGHDDQLDRAMRLCSVPDDLIGTTNPPELSFLLTLADLRPLLTDQLDSRGSSSGLARGGVTFTTPRAVRGIPHRIAYLLDFGDDWLPTGATEEADLLAEEQRPGDPDHRGEARLSLLAAIVSTSDALVITHDSRDVMTNTAVPEGVLPSELLDTLAGLLDGLDDDDAGRRTAVRDHLVVEHPRQATDPANFRPSALTTANRPWSFDTVAYRAARAGAGAADSATHRPTMELSVTPTARVTERVTTIALGDLQRLIHDPDKFVCRDIFDVRLPFEETEPSEHLPIGLDPLERYGLRADLLDHYLGQIPTGPLEARMRASDRLPVAILGDAAFTAADEEAARLAELATQARHGRTRVDITIDLDLADGRRIHGADEIWRGDGDDLIVDVRASKPKDRDPLGAWATLVVFATAHPDQDWKMTQIRSDADPVDYTISTDDQTDPAFRADLDEALGTLIDLFDVARLGPVPLRDELFVKTGAFRTPNAMQDMWSDAFVLSTATRFVYGYRDLDDILDEPVHPDDPGVPVEGLPDRSKGRVAHLHGAFVAKVMQLANRHGSDRP